ncbi:protein kinase domain-containing protein [Humitalea sp. 24SJ18S-53]|uniref:serine/threonine-protein kinase n=1 Tax=Humitalea sp. 24SJ18S-53 TaxID=3422307 RepID=UPI003D6735B3
MAFETVGKYEIRGRLGAGAMGVVLDAWDPVIERRAALKILKKPPAGDVEGAESLARFKREAQAAGRLTHPNIVAVYDYGEDGENAWIAMELVEGGSLKDILDRGERFPLPEVGRIMDQTLAGLDYSHKRGVVHRDIKPANIMLAADRTIKIADFGIARLENSSMTQVGTVMGTPSYMAPEQLRGETVDARADIWASGVMLYQLLTGEKPFEGGFSSVMHKAIHTEPTPPSSLAVTAPRAFDAVISKALAKRPEDRWASAAAFADAIRTAMTAPSQPAPLPMADSDATIVAGSTRPPAAAPPAQAQAKTPAKTGEAPRKGSPVLMIGGGVAVAGAAAVAAFLMLRPVPDPSPVPPSQIALQQPPTPPAPPVVTIQPPAPTAPVLAPVAPALLQPVPQQPAPPILAPVVPPTPTQPVPTPVQQAPVATPPVPVQQAPVQQAPVQQTPVQQTPVQPAPIQPAPLAQAPVEPPAAQKPPVEQAPPPVVAMPQRPPAPQVSPAPPPPLLTPSAPPQQLALVQPPRLDFAAAAAAAAAAPSCALIAAGSTANGLTLRGVARRGDDAAIRRALNARDIPLSAVSLGVQSFDGPYCASFDTLRPVLAAPDAAPQVGVIGSMPLIKGQLLRFDVTMPSWPAHLYVAYFMASGEVAHLVPSAAHGPGATVRLGEPRAGFPGWEVDEPFGTDLLVAVASERPLFGTNRPLVEPQADYIAALSAALNAARQAGSRVAIRPLVIETAAR